MIELLYPHLKHLYSFIDFHGSKSSGGTGQIVNLVKSLIGANIREKIIVLFDNDTEGRRAQKVLSELSPPPNFKILRYPDIDLLKNYPTLAGLSAFAESRRTRLASRTGD